MFICKKDLLVNKGNKVKVIGKLLRIDDPYVVLKSINDDEILINYNEIHKYTDKTVIITGTVQEDFSVQEEMVDVLEGDFCVDTFGKVLELAKKCPNIFNNMN